MHRFKYLALAAALAMDLAALPPKAQAQISINIGAPPDCPYGYFDYPPYACAPYGYYGPEWFLNGVFIGAGPWFHGPAHFHGYVNNRFSPQRGYHGALPRRGAHAMHSVRSIPHFRGNEMRDGRGHVGAPRR